MNYEIKSRFDGRVLYAAGGESLRNVVVAAVKSGADLSGADLSGAYLSGANLRGADLSGADGKKLMLIGTRPVLVIGPIGSRCDYMTAYLTDDGIHIRAGCFFDHLDKFRAAVIETHGDNNHGREYAAAIALIESHAAIWGESAVSK